MKSLKKKVFLLLAALSTLSLASCMESTTNDSKKCHREDSHKSCRHENNCCQSKRKALFGGRKKKNGSNCNNQCTCDCNGDNATCFTQSCRTGTYTSQ